MTFVAFNAAADVVIVRAVLGADNQPGGALHVQESGHQMFRKNLIT